MNGLIVRKNNEEKLNTIREFGLIRKNYTFIQ